MNGSGRAHVPAERGKRVLDQPSLSRSRYANRATSMINGQVTLSPLWITEHAADELRGPDLAVSSSGDAGATSYLDGPGMGSPIDTGPVHRRQWRTGLVPLDILCRCQTMTWRASGKQTRRGPSVRLGVLGFCGRNTNDPPGLPGGSLLVTMTDRHRVDVTAGRLIWGHDGDHTPVRYGHAILWWRIP